MGRNRKTDLKWRADIVLARRATGICIQCEQKTNGDRQLCDGCAERKRVINTKRRYEVRKQVFDHYGNRCNCCGEPNILFLSIDHVNRDGVTHRKETGVSGTGINYWLVKHNFPEGFQVLCFNCNLGRERNGGICPHNV